MIIPEKNLNLIACKNKMLFSIFTFSLYQYDLNKQVVINARRNSLSYNRHIKQIPYHIDEHVDQSNIVIIYPEQKTIYMGTIDLLV